MTALAGGAWYKSAGGCSYIGLKDDVKYSYSWNLDFSSNGNACVQGKGYKKVGQSSQEVWTGLGCGSGGSGAVSWGKVISVSQIKAQSITPLFGSKIRWN